MVVGRELREVFPQAVEKARMYFFKMGLDTIPVVVEFDVLINRFQHFPDFYFCNAFIISHQPVDVFFYQSDDFIFLRDKDRGGGKFPVDKVKLHVVLLFQQLIHLLLSVNALLQTKVAFFLNLFTVFDLFFQFGDDPFICDLQVALVIGNFECCANLININRFKQIGVGFK